MQKPIMIKYILAISLVLLCLLNPGYAEARLTLGAVPVDEQAAGGLTVDRINAIAASIAGRLGEDVTVKEMTSPDSLVNWLDRFAELDLALFTAIDLENYRGRFLMIGPLEKDGSLNLVARRGVRGDLPDRLSEFVRETGFLPGRLMKAPAVAESPVEEKPVAEVPSATRDDVKSNVQRVPQPLPPVQEERAWSPDREISLRDIVPAEKPQLKKLVLGVVPEATGLVHTGEQAELLASYLENALPVEVTVREFEEMETFASWFLRYRMVDLAVISSELAAINLGRDYLPINKFMRSDKPGEESAELLVMRSGQGEELQKLLQQALLDAPKDPEGQQLMAALQLSDVFVPGMRPSPDEVVDEQEQQVLEKVAEPAPEVEPERVSPPPEEPLPPATITVPDVSPPVADVPQVVPLPVDLTDEVSVPSPEMPEDVTEAPRKTPIPDYPAPEQPVSPAEVETVEGPALDKFVKPVPSPPEVIANITVPAIPPVKKAPVVPEPPEEVSPVEVPVPEMAVKEPLRPAMPEPPYTPVVSQELDPAVEGPEEIAVPDAPAVPEKSAEVDAVAAEASDVAEEPSLEEATIIEEVLTFADPVPSHELDKQIYMVQGEDVEGVLEEDLLAMLGADTVASMVAQPDLPQELRPTGVPVVRPRPTPQKKAASVEELLEESVPNPLRPVEPEQPPVLLPQPDPEPGIVYVVPFVSVMVPNEVRSKVFDQFIDSLNLQGEALGLQFLILKEGLQRVDPEWLMVRKHVTGELYAYVEDSGCCSTDLRSRARLTYRRPDQRGTAFDFEYPVRNFFDHDRSTLEIERTKMANDIASTLADELIKALQN